MKYNEDKLELELNEYELHDILCTIADLSDDGEGNVVEQVKIVPKEKEFSEYHKAQKWLKKFQREFFGE